MKIHGISINDEDRAQWVDSDEGLYNWWRSSRQGKTTWVREHRAEIDEVIERVLGTEPSS